MMPIFMGYDKALKTAFEDHGGVCDVVDNEISLTQILKVIRNPVIDILTLKLSKVLKSFFEEILRKRWDGILRRHIKNLDTTYDYVICINGQCVSNSLLRRLKKWNKKAEFILYLWDDVSNQILMPNLTCFDKKFSFNMSDCQTYGAKYLPMFVQCSSIGHKTNEYDIAIIGTAHPDRLIFVRRLLEKYKALYSFYVYMFHPSDTRDTFVHTVPLPYEKYIEILSKSRCVMDIPFILQKGPTTRFFDALQSETKVITVNSDIVNYPVYSENILVVDRNDPEIPMEFVKKEYRVCDIQALTAGEWVEKLLFS